MLALAKHPVVDRHGLSSLSVVMSAAAPLGRDIEEACARRLCQVKQAYGMTELSGGTHLIPEIDAKHKPGSIGLPFPGIECRVVDPATGGELLIRGPIVMKGYLNNPEASASTIDGDGWLHTGDIASFDEDGYFYVIDR